MDDLKRLLAERALIGAEAGIRTALEDTYELEVAGSDTLWRQFRVKAKPKPGYPSEGGPRYFLIKVSEPL
jgi:hypothetical protein